MDYGITGGRYARAVTESSPVPAYPNARSSADGPYTDWRWRTAFQHDFAARMDWTIKDVREANHNPRVVVNGRAGTEPLVVEAPVGTSVTLDAAGTTDPDGDALEFRWFFYPEAGTGIPGRPVVAGRLPRAPAPGAPPHVRVLVDNPSRTQTTVLPKIAGVAHVILAVTDGGTPSLTSYRRVILEIRPAAP